MKHYLALFCLPLLALLSGCATMQRDYEKPKIDLVGITKSETDAAALQFTIQLRIVNPNVARYH